MTPFSLSSSRRPPSWQRLLAALLLCAALCGMQAAGLRHAVAHHTPSWLHSQLEAGFAGDTDGEANQHKAQHYCAALDAVALGVFLHSPALALPATLATHRAPLAMAAWGVTRLASRYFAARAPPTHRITT